MADRVNSNFGLSSHHAAPLADSAYSPCCLRPLRGPHHRRGGCLWAGVAGRSHSIAGAVQLSRPDLGQPPKHLPEKLVVRLVAGPAYPAIVGRSDSLWVIGVEGAMPPNVKPGFGVLVLDRSGKTLGTMLYEGTPVEGAPQIGTVSVGNTTVPLIGIQLDPARIEDPRCPFFPDSVIQ